VAPNTNTKVNTAVRKPDNGKESVKLNSKMELSIRDKLLTKNTMVKVDLLILTEIYTKVTGSMEKLILKVALLKFMRALYTMENGLWMPCMEKESFYGTLDNALTKVNSRKDKEQEKEFTKRELKPIQDKLKTDNSMEKVHMFSIIQSHLKKRIKLFTKEISRIIKS
jgi:CRISPR/Cas system CSM-associated protein Csm2 small subunit